MNIKILFTFLVVMAGCSASESPDDALAFSNAETFDELVEVPKQSPSSPAESSTSRKLIKNGTLEFETQNLKKTTEAIKQAAEAAGGYVANEHSTTNNHQAWNSVVVRVPSSSFDSFITTVSRGVEQFDKREIKSQDVTEEFVDLQARIAAKKKLEQRYLEILKTAGTVKDILQVEAEAGKIREEIERAEGRLKFLESKTSMSTINIGFYKTIEAVALAENTFISSIKEGLRNGVRIIETLIIGLANIWPLLVLALVGWFLYKRNMKRAKASEPS